MFKEVVIVPSGVFLQLFLGRGGGRNGRARRRRGGVVQKVKGLCHLFDMNVIRKKASFGSLAHIGITFLKRFKSNLVPFFKNYNKIIHLNFKLGSFVDPTIG